MYPKKLQFLICTAIALVVIRLCIPWPEIGFVDSFHLLYHAFLWMLVGAWIVSKKVAYLGISAVMMLVDIVVFLSWRFLVE